MESNKNYLAVLATETVLLAAVGAIMYFWGHVYYETYLGSLGQKIDQFDIPPKSFMIASWSNLAAALPMIIGAYLGWHLKDLAATLLAIIIAVLLIPIRKVIGLIPRKEKQPNSEPKTKSETGEPKHPWIDARIDELEIQMKRIERKGVMPASLAIIGILIGALAGMNHMSERAIKHAQQAIEESEKRNAEIELMSDGQMKGRHVATVGDTIIFDLDAKNSFKRILVERDRVETFALIDPPQATAPKAK